MLFEELCDILELTIPYGEIKKKYIFNQSIYKSSHLPRDANKTRLRRRKWQDVWWENSDFFRVTLDGVRKKEEARGCSIVYLIVRMTLQNGTALRGNDFDAKISEICAIFKATNQASLLPPYNACKKRHIKNHFHISIVRIFGSKFVPPILPASGDRFMVVSKLKSSDAPKATAIRKERLET